MNKEKIDQLLVLLENISLAEWKRIKECIDREFTSQINTHRFQERDTFKKTLETEFIQ